MQISKSNITDKEWVILRYRKVNIKTRIEESKQKMGNRTYVTRYVSMFQIITIYFIEEIVVRISSYP